MRNSLHISESEKLHKAVYKEAKDIADDVTLSNDEDGVADWIEKNILQSQGT